MPEKKPIKKTAFWVIVKTIYLYLVSLIALIILTINIGRFLNLALEIYVFPIDEGIEDSWEIDQCMQFGLSGRVAIPEEKMNGEVKPSQEEIDNCVEQAEKRVALRVHNDRNRTLASSSAFVIVSLPIWFLHYRRALKIKDKDKDKK